MKRLIVLFVLVGLIAVHVVSLQAAPSTFGTKDKPDAPAKGKPIADQYIVVLKDSADSQAVAASIGLKPKYAYREVLKGFAGTLNAQQLDALRRNPQVDYIEQDQEISVSNTQYSPTWGLDRVDQRFQPLSGSYSYASAGAGVYAYIIDTGIESSHPDFGGRAYNVYDAFGGSGEDCHGHGTHVAGTVGSATYGIAKQVQLRGVRVMNCSGGGTISGLIAGIDWVRRYGQRPAVANMSVAAGTHSSSLNTATTNLANAYVFAAVAADNLSANACNYSPGNAAGAFTVAASDSNDSYASFSNYGSCIDIYAPGDYITSTYLGGSTNILSGTSMASPHVAGAAALYKSTYGDTSTATIGNWLINTATANVIANNPYGTPNRLLFIGSESFPPPPEPTEPMCGQVYC